MPFNKPDISQLSAVGSAVGDVYFPQTELLLPFNGTNGATTTSDSSNNNVAVTFVGTSQISTAQSKFGGSSMLFDGNSDYLTVNHSSFGSFATSTFTIEFWVYYNSLGSYVYNINNYSGASNGMIISKGTSHVLEVYLTGDGADITGTTTVTTGQWYHMALSGSSGSYKLFLDGVQEGSTYTGSISTGSNTWQLGAFYWSGSFYHGLDGYLDDVRFTAGIARYTSAFTPPTTAHLTSAGDVNKQILINETADGVAIGTGGINQARIAKAWANINGTGTISIRGSYNVSSLTDVGTGSYKVNFSTVMTDNNYVGFCAGAEVDGGSTQNHLFHIKRETPISDILNTAYIHVASANTGGTQTDDGLFCVVVFGN